MITSVSLVDWKIEPRRLSAERRVMALDRFLFFATPKPPTSTLFPYTTLFRSISNPHGFLKAARLPGANPKATRSEEHTSELQSRLQIVCRLLRETTNRWSIGRSSRGG